MKNGKHSVRLYFDFISPYSYLALTQVERFGEEHGTQWTVRPVLYAAVLDRWGLIGPAEEPVKREYTTRDIVRAADRLGVPLVGPPEHPFNSLVALRTVCVFQDDERALRLAVRLASLCWGEGQPLTHLETLIAAVDECRLPAAGLAERIASPEIKDRLRANTEEALEAGVFGVPTFIWEGELFWGHDRLEHLADRLTGRLGSPEERGRVIAARPKGAGRPSVAGRKLERG
ncbi:MAG TPA: 2-hydroxychromene-2-carboxylate isomerase [Gemmatimonadota bacterium]|nr:2-hydroxychromene-2-carboxylate isomerase [Gemmatimonadota bacterium]